jgi:hypothetical protein
VLCGEPCSLTLPRPSRPSGGKCLTGYGLAPIIRRVLARVRLQGSQPNPGRDRPQACSLISGSATGGLTYHPGRCIFPSTLPHPFTRRTQTMAKKKPATPKKSAAKKPTAGKSRTAAKRKNAVAERKGARVRGATKGAAKEVYSVFLHVTHCDNQLQVYVNGHKVYERYTDYDHLLNDQILLPYIVWGNNQVRVVGTNGPTNPPNQIKPVQLRVRDPSSAEHQREPVRLCQEGLCPGTHHEQRTNGTVRSGVRQVV